MGAGWGCTVRKPITPRPTPKPVPTKTEEHEKPEEIKNGEAEAAVREGNYELAIQKFDEAFNLARGSPLAETIKNSKVEALKAFAKKLFQEAIALEADDTRDNSREAQSKFDKAKSLYQQAQRIRYSNVGQKNLDVVSAKIDGNQLFNQASSLEQSGFKIFEKAQKSKLSGDYSMAESTYREALARYEEAKKKFEIAVKIGSKNFQESVRVINKQIEEVKSVIKAVEIAGLKATLTQTTIEKKVERSTDDDGKAKVKTKVQQQI